MTEQEKAIILAKREGFVEGSLHYGRTLADARLIAKEKYPIKFKRERVVTAVGCAAYPTVRFRIDSISGNPMFAYADDNLWRRLGQGVFMSEDRARALIDVIDNPLEEVEE